MNLSGKEKFDPITEEDIRKRVEFENLSEDEQRKEIDRLQTKAELENAETFYDKLKTEDDEVEQERIRLTIEIAEKVRDLGGLVLVVGGYARDEALRRFGYNLHPKDVDLEIYGLGYNQLLEIVRPLGKVTEDAGKSFPVLKLNNTLDIALPRRERKVATGHRGFEVDTSSDITVEEASLRRDITINAMGLDPLTGQIIDKHNGIQDIQNKVIRATTELSFQEDPLRILRAMQFAGRFGFNIDKHTGEMARKIPVAELRSLPKERIGEEWYKLLLKSPKPSIGLDAALELGVIDAFHPELAALIGVEQDPDWHPEGDVWIHSKMVIDIAAEIIRREELDEEGAYTLMLAALCHDLGKPATTVRNEDGKVTAHGHPEAGLEPAKVFLRTINVLRSEDYDTTTKKVLNLIRDHLFPLQNSDASPTAIRRLAKRLHPATIQEVVWLSEADNRGKSTDRGQGVENLLLEKARQLNVDKSKVQPFLMGRDLLRLGMNPGPEMGKLLSKIEGLQEEGEISNYEEAERYAREALEGIPSKEAIENFLKFREASANKLDTLVADFYKGEKNIDSIYEALNLPEGDGELRKIVPFILEAFSGKKRKDDRNLAIHSLQLFKNSNYFGIGDKDIQKTLLLHDVIEDTPYTKEDIKKSFGEKAAAFVDTMTESRSSDDRGDDLIKFIKQLAGGGRVILIAEILDRIDDLSDINYITKKLSDTISAGDKKELEKSLIGKFAKCKFTIDTLLQQIKEKPQIAENFYELYKHQVEKLNLPENLIENKVREYGRQYDLISDKSNQARRGSREEMRADPEEDLELYKINDFPMEYLAEIIDNLRIQVHDKWEYTTIHQVFSGALGAKKGRIFVMHDNDKIAGIGVASLKNDKEGKLEALYVIKKYRKMNIGMALTEARIKYFLALGVEKIYITVISSGSRAIAEKLKEQYGDKIQVQDEGNYVE